MNLILKRLEYSDPGVFGTLMDESCRDLFATLERSYLMDNAYLPKLPIGEYVCRLGIHRLANGKAFQTYEITGVPGHSGILFHCGNVENDSEGCVLVGSWRDGDRIVNSRAAFERFMKLQNGLAEFKLSVTV